MKLIFSQTITLANAQPIKVTLGEDTQVLDEVVVTMKMLNLIEDEYEKSK